MLYIRVMTDLRLRLPTLDDRRSLTAKYAKQRREFRTICKNYDDLDTENMAHATKKVQSSKLREADRSSNSCCFLRSSF